LASVKQLIELFVAVGCELGELPGHIEMPGGATHKVRYLYSSVTDAFVSLSNLQDDERMPPSTVANWERRLGLEIPKKPSDWR
jgi:hypothetical protein